MKKYTYLLSLSLILMSCAEQHNNITDDSAATIYIDYGYSESVIYGYMYVSGITVDVPEMCADNYFDVYLKYNPDNIACADAKDEDLRELYLSTCKELGDTDWNKNHVSALGLDEFLYFGTRWRSINVTVEQDWDAAHPKGSLLNDLMTIKIVSAVDFIGSESYYDTDIIFPGTVVKPLSEISSDDFRCYKQISLNFVSAPERIGEYYDMHIVATDVDGNTYSCSERLFWCK